MSLSVSTTKGSEKGNAYYLDRARSPFARRTYASGSAEAKESKSSPAASWANLKEYEHICGKEAKLYAPKETGENHGIGRIELDRPHAANAVGKKLLADLEECTQKAAELGRTNRIRCLVFHSSIKIFCAGADLKERKAMTDPEVISFVSRLRKCMSSVEYLPMPTIAALDGAALGGGLELALACDLRVGSDQCVVALPETRIAIIPGAGGTQRLPRLIGLSKAKDLIFTGRKLRAYEAFEMGILDRYTHQQKKAVDESLALAHSISQGGPIALQMAKRAVQQGMGCSDMESALEVEASCYGKVVPTKDRIEALRAFSEKRNPVFEGR